MLQAVKNAECFANVCTYVLSEDLHSRGLTDMNTFPEVELHEVVTLTEYYFPQIAFLIEFTKFDKIFIIFTQNFLLIILLPLVIG